MINRQEILEIKDTYIDELYGNVRKEQKDDLKYIEDTFEVPEVKEPHKIYRSGLGNDWVNAPAEHIVTNNPQAFIEDVKGGKRGTADNIGKEANRQLSILSLTNPNTFKEFVKNLNARGEAYIQLAHNGLWVTGKKEKVGLPVHYAIPDPMVIYGSPEEDENGIPERVIVFYERQPIDVILIYGQYLDVKLKNYLMEKAEKRTKIEWWEYWDKDVKYFEADTNPVLTGEIQENLYGFPPFIRKYSGFGKRSPDGDLSKLIVSDIRYARDLIHAECVNWSNINSIEWLFAHRGETIFSADELGDKAIEELKEKGAYQVRVVDGIKDISQVKVEKDELAPVPPQMYQHRQDIWANIFRRNPYVTAGWPSGSSGRQDDLAYMAARKRYDTIIENTQNAFGTAVEKVFEICNKKGLKALKPDDINKSDLEAKFKCQVKLKADDPVEQDRLSLSGRTQVQMGQLSLRSNLIKFQGLTAEQADNEIDEILAERYMFQSPDIAELMQVRAAEKSGMAEDMEALKARRMELEKRIKEFPLGAQFGSQGGEPRTGNIKSPQGLEQSTYQRGQRSPYEA